MKIKTLDIYGYGKWINQRFDLDEHLQLFYGPNEAGKSTLQSFIRSILFGFPSRRKRVNQLNRYEPKNSDSYGGRILLTETAYGNIWIERTNQNFSIQTEEGDSLEASILESVLSGLDERLFDTFYAFNLQNLQELSQLDASQINDYFLSIGTVGSDQFIKIAKQLEKETNELYRPQGQNRPINQMLSDYDVLAQKTDQIRQTMMEYDELVRHRNIEEEAILELNKEMKELEYAIRESDKLIGRYDNFLKYRATNRELEQLVFTEIDPEFSTIITDAHRQINENHVELAQLEERIKLLRGEIGTMTRLNWAINHEEERKTWLVKTQNAKEVQSKIEYAEGRINEQEKMMHDLSLKGQFYPEKISNSSEYQAQLDKGLEIQARKVELSKQEDNLKAERKVYIEQRKEQQNYSAIVRSQIAKLENQRMNDEAVLIEETSLKHYFMSFIFIILGLVLLGSSLINRNSENNVLMLLGGGLGIVGFLSSIYVFFGHRKKFLAFHNSPIINKIQELRDKEQAYQEQSKLVGIQINQREEALELLSKDSAGVAQELQKWLVSIGFYPTADAELVLKSDPVKAYFEAEALKNQFESEKEEYEAVIKSWRQLLQPFFERFPFESDSVRALIRYVEELEAQLKVTQFRGENLNEKIAEAQNEIDTLQNENQTLNNKIQEILSSTGSQNENEFYQKVRDNERINELKANKIVYFEQIDGFEEQLMEVENKQILVESYKRLEAKLEYLREQLAPHHSERANLEVAIRNLEQDGTYQSLIQQLETKRAELRDAIINWGSKRIATELIYRTLRHGIEDPVPTMLSIANEIFEKLSYGRYTQIKLNQSDIRVMQFSGVLFEPHELSQGTLEQLYVALRLAFVQSATSMVKLPIIIDDAFVNFDDLRKTSMYQVLETFSKETQILFFTFDHQALESFTPGQTINLSEIQQVESVVES